jgi:hypothetical protein
LISGYPPVADARTRSGWHNRRSWDLKPNYVETAIIPQRCLTMAGGSENLVPAAKFAMIA